MEIRGTFRNLHIRGGRPPKRLVFCSPRPSSMVENIGVPDELARNSLLRFLCEEAKSFSHNNLGHLNNMTARYGISSAKN